LLQNVNVLHANEAEAKNDRGGEKVTWSGGDAGGSGCGRGGGVGGGCSLSFSPLFLSSIPSLSSVVPSLGSAPLLPLQFCWRWAALMVAGWRWQRMRQGWWCRRRLFSFLLSSVSLLNPFSVFRCSLSRLCSFSSSSVLLALGSVDGGGSYWEAR